MIVSEAEDYLRRKLGWTRSPILLKAPQAQEEATKGHQAKITRKVCFHYTRDEAHARLEGILCEWLKNALERNQTDLISPLGILREMGKEQELSEALLALGYVELSNKLKGGEPCSQFETTNTSTR